MRNGTWSAIGRGSVRLAGFGLLCACTAAGSAWPTPAACLFWLGLVLIADRATIAWRSATLGLRAFVTFAALLQLGVAPTAWLVLAAAMLALPQRRHLARWRQAQGWLAARTATAGSRLLVVGATGLVFAELGGRSGAGLTTWSFVATTAAAATYLLVQAVADGMAAVPGRRRRSRPAQEMALLASWDALQLCGSVAWVLAAQALGLTAAILMAVPLTFAAIAHAQWQRVQSGHLEAVRTLMATIDAADPMTRGQSARIAKMSMQVGRRLGLEPQATAELEYAALLHEVGRTAIQRELMFKPGALSNQEQAVMRTHPQLGCDAVQRFGFFPGAAELVLAHHEQPDGRGYPDGLHAEAIPLGSGILMATAAFDAMTSDRPYRRGLTPEAAVESLLALAGQQFFPDVVEALIDLYTSGELFAAFDADELERYAQGEGGSRLLQEHLRRHGGGPSQAAPVPAVASDDVPTLDLPIAPRPEVEQQDVDLGDGLHLQVAALSDVGCTREHNEDAFGVFTSADGCLLVVADGMGGAAAGEVASRLAVECIGEDYLAAASTSTGGAALLGALQRANSRILAQAEAASELLGMGTTCTAATLVGTELHVSHVGDSRAYLLRDKTIEILTRDHTLAAELQLVSGSAGPAEARHVLTRCLGTQAAVDIDVARPLRLHDGDILVLCSDGLHGQVPAHEIRAVVQGDSPAMACTRLVEVAIERGGPDNISVIVARVRRA